MWKTCICSVRSEKQRAGQTSCADTDRSLLPSPGTDADPAAEKATKFPASLLKPGFIVFCKVSSSPRASGPAALWSAVRQQNRFLTHAGKSVTEADVFDCSVLQRQILIDADAAITGRSLRQQPDFDCLFGRQAEEPHHVKMFTVE